MTYVKEPVCTFPGLCVSIDDSSASNSLPSAALVSGILKSSNVLRNCLSIRVTLN